MNTPLTEQILSIIIAVQAYKTFVCAHHQFVIDNKQFDWHLATQSYFNSLPRPKELPANHICFEGVLRFQVTDEMRGTTFSQLPEKFTFSY